MGTGEVILLVWISLVFVPAIPAYVVARRLGVSNAGVAFIPFVGATIVILWSIEKSGWMSLLGLIPLVNLVFSIWLVVTVPSEHGRTGWWTLPFLIPLVQVVAFYAYAFTMPKPDDSQAPSFATP